MKNPKLGALVVLLSFVFSQSLAQQMEFDSLHGVGYEIGQYELTLDFVHSVTFQESEKVSWHLFYATVVRNGTFSQDSEWVIFRMEKNAAGSKVMLDFAYVEDDDLDDWGWYDESSEDKRLELLQALYNEGNMVDYQYIRCVDLLSEGAVIYERPPYQFNGAMYLYYKDVPGSPFNDGG